jgi:uncharacterized repeat protein (TIGR03803 family)
MKTYIKNLFLLPALIAGLNLIPTGRVSAQAFTTLYSFTGGSDGAIPYAGLILSGNTLYGTTEYGGSSGWGVVFAVHTDGTGFTNLHSFTGGSGGYYPLGELILSGNTLYGTTPEGGSSFAGTVFKLNTNGTGFTTLHSFIYGSDGGYPNAGLILSGNTLYGTAGSGGLLGSGTVFKLQTNGTGFTNLHSFTAIPYLNYTNSDGAGPQAGLILSGTTLYGTANWGGSEGDGTVFKLNTNGTGFTNLHNFTRVSDGAYPVAELILSGNTLYGTAVNGGNADNGTVFKVNTDGTGFTNLHSFTAAGDNTSSVPSNSDGANPQAGLILSGNTLYGTATGGGSSDWGTVFAVNTNGTGFTNLHSFTGGSDGAYPYAGLILSGNTLYGTAVFGGSSGNGTVFSLSLGSVSAPAPTLTIVPSGTNVVLTWPVNAAGFTLQSTTNLVSPVVWSTVSPGPVVVNGQYAVTNSTSGTNKFYQLSQ